MTKSLMPFFQLSPLFYCSPCICGDTFGFAGLCVSDFLFGRFHHYSVEIVNGDGRFILEDAEAVPMRDAELLLYVSISVEYDNQFSTYGINGCRSMCVAASGRD